MNLILKNLFKKILISRRIAELEDLDRLYLEGRFDEYFVKLRHFLTVLRLELPTISARYQEAFQFIEESVHNQTAEKAHHHSLHLTALLNREYDSLNVRPNLTIRRLSFSLLLLLILALVTFAINPLKEKQKSELIKDDLLKNEEAFASKTISDLFDLKKALQQYFEDNKQYPTTSSTWYGVVSPFGQAKTDWIPGLAPKYIKTLPNDPRKYRQPMEQYMYQSDGRDFKLMAHFPVGMEAAINQHPELVDPRRPSWAIGCWSEGAKNW